MPSKLRKAIGAVKDQTSISLAKVTSNNASSFEVAILKATTHEEVPIDERYINEILQTISSNKVFAAICAQALAKRIGKTKNWIVALKCLMLVLRIFQDGDPFFPREVLHAKKRGAKILNLSSFRDDSNSSPWDYTAYVRTFALYLDERLDCFLTGKLQRRYTNTERRTVLDMKPVMLLDKISYWQRLLDRAMGTKPTGAARTNRLVQISLYAIVRESFDLYRDISDGLALLLDSFFHLQYQSCVSSFQSCVKASRQFEELCAFYDSCKSIGIGRTSEYPSIQKISEELIETLQEFLKDEASFPANGRSPNSHLSPPVPPARDPGSCSERSYGLYSEQTDRFSERESQFGSRSPSFEDFMTATESGTISPSLSMERFSDISYDKQSIISQQEDMFSAAETASNHSLPNIEQGTNVAIDLVSFDEWPSEDQKQEQEKRDVDIDQKQEQEKGAFFSIPNEDVGDRSSSGWELVLVEAAKQPEQQGFENSADNNGSFQSSMANAFFDQTSVPHQRQYNPFLEDETDMSPTSSTAGAATFVDDIFQMDPTFQASATFFAQNPSGSTSMPTFQARPTFFAEGSGNEMTTTAAAFQDEDDPFAPWPIVKTRNHVSNGNVDQQNLFFEQQLWLQNQNKIIAKHVV